MYMNIMFLSLAYTSMEREEQRDQSSTDALSGTHTLIEIELCISNVNREDKTIGPNE